jgi:serine/threonine protein kinase
MTNESAVNRDPLANAPPLVGAEPPAARNKFTYASGSRPLADYTIKRGVGIGGFGEVYFAISDAGKEVALKRVQRNHEVELRGAKHCLNLKHPNLVDLYDIKFDDQGGAWVVMEFMTGENLKEVIDRNPNGMPREEILRWFHAMAEGVAYLHDQGIVHRDLKPGNVFIDQGIVKIGDYGLSKFISQSASGHTESVGTFHYMAPEIGRGSYGKEIDIYALGIVLFEMLTGHVPFDGESSQEIIMRHLTEDADVDALPQPFRRVIARALLKDPDQRYENVREMLFDLESLPTATRVNSEAIVTATAVGTGSEPHYIGDSNRNPPADANVLYISDEPPPREMQFGPVQVGPAQRHPAARFAPVSNSAANPARAASTSPRGNGELATPAPTLRRVANANSDSGHDSFQRLSLWLDSSWLSTTLKVSLVMIAILVICFRVEWLIPLGIIFTMAFMVLAGVSFIAHNLQARPTPPQTGITFRSWQEMVRDQLRGKAWNIRMGELLGSWLMAAVICALLGLVMIVVVDQFAPSVDVLATYTWLTISAVLASWCVLTVGKFCEGIESDAVRRRVVMLALGLLSGALAFGLSQVLFVNLKVNETANTSIASTMYDSAGSPQLPLFLVFFGALMAMPTWWKQTDPLRRTRVNLLALGFCVLTAWLLQLVWPFPEQWGYMIAVIISLAVQLSAPWMTQRERDSARREFRRV